MGYPFAADVDKVGSMLKQMLKRWAGQRAVEAAQGDPLRDLWLTEAASYDEFRQQLAARAEEEQERRRQERRLVPGAEPFTVAGRCQPCGRDVDFRVGWEYSYPVDGELTPNWREHLFCGHCGLNNRMRAAIHLFHHLFTPSEQAKLYLTEQATPIFTWFARHFTGCQGSEYLADQIPYGAVDERGIRNETLTSLSFPDEVFDFLLSFDVLEHIPDFKKGFSECLRVLKPGGGMFFSVPFDVTFRRNLVRAVLDEQGEIDHLVEPEYHYDPVREEGCLAFYCYGWELLDQLRDLGFEEVQVHSYWSPCFGYLGGGLSMLTARKR